MNFRITAKNDAADTKIGFLTRSISKPYGRATAMPRVWELKAIKSKNILFLKSVVISVTSRNTLNSIRFWKKFGFRTEAGAFRNKRDLRG